MTKKPIDWTGIEHDYRTGDMSVRDLAKWFSVSEAAVRKRAKAGSWTRNGDAPKAPVKKAEISVTYAVTETAVTTSTTDPEEIIARGRNLALRMLDELHAATSHVGELEFCIEEATAGDESERRREAMMKAISLPMRANTLKALAQAAETLTKVMGGADGKKAQRQAAADQSAGGGGRFSVRSGPRLAVDNG